MKFTLLTLSALLATVVAQGLGDLPDCSKDCATGAIPKDCGIDFKCICEAKSFLSDVSCCVADKCSKEDQETTLKVAKSLCARGGVTDLPTAVVCSTGASSTSTSTSSSSSSSSSETGDKTGTEASAATNTASTASTTDSASASASASASSSSAATTSTGAADLTHRDSSLVAAAGAAAAFALFI